MDPIDTDVLTLTFEFKIREGWRAKLAAAKNLSKLHVISPILILFTLSGIPAVSASAEEVANFDQDDTDDEEKSASQNWYHSAHPQSFRLRGVLDRIPQQQRFPIVRIVARNCGNSPI